MILLNDAEKENSPSIKPANGINSPNLDCLHIGSEENEYRYCTTLKKKRKKTSPYQLEVLQRTFETDPMPSASVRMALAVHLGMTSRSVQIWFQNRRAKGKHKKCGCDPDMIQRLRCFSGRLQSQPQAFSSTPSSISSFSPNHPPHYNINATVDDYRNYLLRMSEFPVQGPMSHLAKYDDAKGENIMPEKKEPQRCHEWDTFHLEAHFDHQSHWAPHEEKESCRVWNEALNSDEGCWHGPIICPFGPSCQSESEVAHAHREEYGGSQLYWQQCHRDDRRPCRHHYCIEEQEAASPHIHKSDPQRQENRHNSSPLSPPPLVLPSPVSPL